MREKRNEVPGMVWNTGVGGKGCATRHRICLPFVQLPGDLSQVSPERETARTRLIREMCHEACERYWENGTSLEALAVCIFSPLCFSAHLILISTSTWWGGRSLYPRGCGRSVSVGSQGDAGSHRGSSCADGSCKNTSLAAKGEGAPWALSHDTDGPWVILLIEPKSIKKDYRMEILLLHFFLVIKKMQIYWKKPESV